MKTWSYRNLSMHIPWLLFHSPLNHIASMTSCRVKLRTALSPFGSNFPLVCIFCHFLLMYRNIGQIWCHGQSLCNPEHHSLFLEWFYPSCPFLSHHGETVAHCYFKQAAKWQLLLQNSPYVIGHIHWSFASKILMRWVVHSCCCINNVYYFP